MAKGEIRVPADNLKNIGRLFQNKAQTFTERLNDLSKTMQYVLDESSGDFKQTAVVANADIKRDTEAAIKQLKVFGDWCLETANAFEEADRMAAQKAGK